VVVQHYQAGFQLGKSTTELLFALRQILKKATKPTSQLIISSKTSRQHMTP
jgi:hypothetical protein